MTPLLFIWSTVALFLLRIFFGLLFVIHGWPKIKNLRKNADNFTAMGFRPGIFWGTVVALLEFFGGLVLLIGLFVQIIGLLFAIEMIVATLWRVKNKHHFIGGYEFELALVLIGLVLATAGGGLYALDNLFQFLIY